MRFSTRVFTIFLLLSFFLLSGCDSPKHVVVFVDVSKSAQNSKDLFQSELLQIQEKLAPGDKITIARITDHSLTAFRPIVNIELPKFEFWADNTRDHKTELTSSRAVIAKTVDDFFENIVWSGKTDILNTLVLTRKILAEQKGRKILILMSDMIEDSAAFNFEKIAFDSEQIEKIIELQRSKNLLPDLADVTVFVTGASAASAEKAHDIESFWRAYFRETGAYLPDNQYSPTLLVIPE